MLAAGHGGRAGAAVLAGDRRPRDRRWRVGAAVRAPALPGLAVVADAAAGDVAWIPAALFDDAAVREAARAAARAGDGRPVHAHDAKRVMQALWRGGRRPARASASTPPSPPT